MPDEHMSPDERELDAFATRVAHPLRGRESLDASFEARVMTAVLADAAKRGQPAPAPAAPARQSGAWWRRSRTIRLSPLGSLAVAAGIVAIAALGAMGGAALRPAAPTDAAALARAAAPETVHVVRFVLTDPRARAVSLVGDFNGWAKETTPLVAGVEGGTWSVSVPVRAGRHEYAFVVRRDDGERWVADPLAARVRDEFGVESSLVTIGDAGRDAPLPRRT